MQTKNIQIFITLFSLLVFSNSILADTISVKKAMEMNIVNVVLSKKAPPEKSDDSYSSYTGDCITMTIENLTNKNIKVWLEPGRFMMPEDSTEQSMIVTREQMIALYKNQKKEIPVFAMCSEMNDAAPSASCKFSMGEKAEGDLLALAQLISKNNWQDMAAQSAIWAITDNNDFADIYSSNKDEMKLLRDFVKEVKGITTPALPQGDEIFQINTESENTYLKYSKGKVSGSFEFTIKTDLNLSMMLYNDSGEVVRKSLTNYTFKAGTNKLTYTYSYFGIPLGNYYVKLLDDKNSIFLEKMITIK